MKEVALAFQMVGATQLRGHVYYSPRGPAALQKERNIFFLTNYQAASTAASRQGKQAALPLSPKVALPALAPCCSWKQQGVSAKAERQSYEDFQKGLTRFEWKYAEHLSTLFFSLKSYFGEISVKDSAAVISLTWNWVLCTTASFLLVHCISFFEQQHISSHLE